MMSPKKKLSLSTSLHHVKDSICNYGCVEGVEGVLLSPLSVTAVCWNYQQSGIGRLINNVIEEKHKSERGGCFAKY